MVVQSVTTLSLVIALPLGAKFTSQQISGRVIAGAVAAVLGIVLFLFVGSPQGGTSQPDAVAWWSAVLASVAVIGLLSGFAWHSAGAVKALLLGSAAGVCFALQAAVTKVFMTDLEKGIVALLGNWTSYALIASAVVGFVLQQSALRTNVLAPAMAASNAVTLFASVIFGLTVFGESLSQGRLAPAIIGLAFALVGVVLLAGAKPPRAVAPGSKDESYPGRLAPFGRPIVVDPAKPRDSTEIQHVLPRRGDGYHARRISAARARPPADVHGLFIPLRGRRLSRAGDRLVVAAATE